MEFCSLPAEDQCGAWISGYAISFDLVTRALNEATQAATTIESERTRLENEGLESMEADHQLLAEREHELDLTVRAVLFSCLWVEGTINHYGTVSLGEEFFRSNVEKLSVSSKLSVIVAIRKQKLIARESESLRTIERLFDARNRLVHRKTRQLDCSNPSSQLASIPKSLELIKQASTAVNRLRRFLLEIEDGFPVLTMSLDCCHRGA